MLKINICLRCTFATDVSGFRENEASADSPCNFGFKSSRVQHYAIKCE